MNSNIDQLISFGIPTFNSQQFIHKIYSNIRKYFPKSKIYFVDDCSLDDTVTIIKKIIEYDKNVHLIINKKNYGTGRARNILFDICKEKYLWQLDSDDQIYLTKKGVNMLKKQIYDNFDLILLNHFKLEKFNFKHKILFNNFKFFYPFVKNKSWRFKYFSYKYQTINKETFYKLGNWMCNKIWNTSFFKSLNIKFPESIYDDEILMCVFSKIKNISYNPYISYLIYNNNESVSRSIDEKAEKIKILLRNTYDTIKKFDGYDQYKIEFIYFVYRVLYCAKNTISSNDGWIVIKNYINKINNFFSSKIFYLNDGKILISKKYQNNLPKYLADDLEWLQK